MQPVTTSQQPVHLPPAPASGLPSPGPQIRAPQVDSIEKIRADIWKALQNEFNSARQVLENLSLGWDIFAQVARSSGISLLNITEQKQEQQFQRAQTTPDLYIKLQHVLVNTFPGLCNQIPTSSSFQPVRDFFPQSLERLTSLSENKFPNFSRKSSIPTAENTPPAASPTLITENVQQPAAPSAQQVVHSPDTTPQPATPITTKPPVIAPVVVAEKPEEKGQASELQPQVEAPKTQTPPATARNVEEETKTNDQPAPKAGVSAQKTTPPIDATQAAPITAKQPAIDPVVVTEKPEEKGQASEPQPQVEALKTQTPSATAHIVEEETKTENTLAPVIDVPAPKTTAPINAPQEEPIAAKPPVLAPVVVTENQPEDAPKPEEKGQATEPQPQAEAPKEEPLAATVSTEEEKK